MAAQRQCQKCGATYPAREKFCMADGAPLPEPKVIVEPRPTAPTGLHSKSTDRHDRHQQDTHVFARQVADPDLWDRETMHFQREEPATLVPAAGADGTERTVPDLWLDLQRAWVRLSGHLLAGDSDAFLRERDHLDRLLDLCEGEVLKLE